MNAAQANMPAKPLPTGVCKNINSGGGNSEEGTAVVSTAMCDCEVAITECALLVITEVTSVDNKPDSLVELIASEVENALSAAIYSLFSNTILKVKVIV